MGIARHDWILYHDIAGFAFAILLIIHLLLHWKFFRHINRRLTRETDNQSNAEK
ncbi:MAG TPA: DUF4405 domain-containing protein [Methanoregula sp.]|nr:DUF4405 domain-containing protein [Methanoregula sp.]